MNANRNMIVPAEPVALARALSEAASGPAGAGMWAVGLSHTGLPPATHYISAGQIAAEFADLMPLTTYDADGVATTVPGKPEVIAELTGGQVPVEEITALLDASHVTDGDVISPFEAMAMLNLKFVQEEL